MGSGIESRPGVWVNIRYPFIPMLPRAPKPCELVHIIINLSMQNLWTLSKPPLDALTKKEIALCSARFQRFRRVGGHTVSFVLIRQRFIGPTRWLWRSRWPRCLVVLKRLEKADPRQTHNTILSSARLFCLSVKLGLVLAPRIPAEQGRVN
jgi:hypothetical protein